MIAFSMKIKPKVVFDTNIYISGILFGGIPRNCLELAKSENVELFVSNKVLLELADKLDKKFFLNPETTKKILKEIAKFSQILFPKTRINHIKRDPADNMILECALEAKADYIISGDKKHLLSLKNFKNIPIVSAREFMDLYYNKN